LRMTVESPRLAASASSGKRARALAMETCLMGSIVHNCTIDDEQPALGFARCAGTPSRARLYRLLRNTFGALTLSA
jgi:hypothetical protein